MGEVCGYMCLAGFDLTLPLRSMLLWIVEARIVHMHWTVYEYRQPPPAYKEILLIPGNLSNLMKVTDVTDLVTELIEEPGFSTLR